MEHQVAGANAGWRWPFRCAAHGFWSGVARAFLLIGIVKRMEYSSTVEFLLFAVWAVGSLLLAWFVRCLLYVYFGSVALSAPMIGYSMVGYGLLLMGGIIQGFCAGLFVLPFYFLFQRLRTRKMGSR